jgi:hypothetical protein
MTMVHGYIEINKRDDPESAAKAPMTDEEYKELSALVDQYAK